MTATDLKTNASSRPELNPGSASPVSGLNRQDLLYLSILLIIAALLFSISDVRGLWEVDESRYGEMAREMVESGDWITPTLNYVKYFEKPILTFWMMAAGFKLFGLSELSARLTPALCAALTVCCVYFLGRRIWNRRAGFYSALVLSTCVLFIGLSQTVLVDMPLTLGVCLAILGACCARGQRGYGLYLFWAGISIGFLSKGVLGIGLPWLLVVAFVLCSREWRFLRRLLNFKGPLLFIALCAPWYVLIGLKHPEFIAFFIDEHWQRLFTNTHSRWQPPYFYLGVVPAGFLPWIFIFPWCLKRLWPGAKNLLAASNRDLLWVGLWLVTYFLFFSASNSKLIHYVAPIMPPMALLTGRAIQQWDSAALEKAPRFLSNSVLLLAAFTFLAGITPVVAPRLLAVQFNDFASTLPGIVLPLLLVAAAVVIYFWRKKPWAALRAPLLAALLLIVCAVPLSGALNNWNSIKYVVQMVDNDMGPDDIVVAYKDHYYGLAYYTKRRMVIVENWGELEFGRLRAPDREAWFLQNEAQLLDLIGNGKKVWILCSEQDYAQLLQVLGEERPGLLREKARLGRWIILAG